MDVLLIEPYYGGSHRAWVDGYCRCSQHTVTTLTLPAQFWKWRMQGGAVTLARQFNQLDNRPDVILVSDMIDLATFRALAQLDGSPLGLYFHESQLTYPQNRRQGHGWRYAFTNYVGALVADAVFFNSHYHYDVFFENLPRMLKHFADFNELDTIDAIREKSSVLPLGLDLSRYDTYRREVSSDSQEKLIVWNHRWEQEKNPQTFFGALYRLMAEGIDFRVALTGENFRQNPAEFEQARSQLGDRIVQYGYVADFADYARLLWQADIVVSTAHQEFFGGAVAEAIYCGCVPLLPNRLNYPYLVPQDAQDVCIYPKDASLYYLLKAHLTGEKTIDTAPLRDHIMQFDWSRMAPRYDDALRKIRVRHPLI